MAALRGLLLARRVPALRSSAGALAVRLPWIPAPAVAVQPPMRTYAAPGGGGGKQPAKKLSKQQEQKRRQEVSELMQREAAELAAMDDVEDERRRLEEQAAATGTADGKADGKAGGKADRKADGATVGKAEGAAAAAAEGAAATAAVAAGGTAEGSAAVVAVEQQPGAADIVGRKLGIEDDERPVTAEELGIDEEELRRETGMSFDEAVAMARQLAKEIPNRFTAHSSLVSHLERKRIVKRIVAEMEAEIDAKIEAEEAAWTDEASEDDQDKDKPDADEASEDEADEDEVEADEADADEADADEVDADEADAEELAQIGRAMEDQDKDESDANEPDKGTWLSTQIIAELEDDKPLSEADKDRILDSWLARIEATEARLQELAPDNLDIFFNPQSVLDNNPDVEADNSMRRVRRRRGKNGQLLYNLEDDPEFMREMAPVVAELEEALAAGNETVEFPDEYEPSADLSEDEDLNDIELPDLITNAELVNNFFRLTDDFQEKMATFPLKFLETPTGVFRGPHILYRATTHLLLAELEQRREKADTENPLLMIDGTTGTGKSVAMLHAVHHAVQNGWLVVYMPDASEFASGKYPYKPVNVGGQKVWQQPDGLSALLKHVQKTNGALLEQIILPEDVVVGKRRVAAGATLAELVKLGVADYALAPDAVVAMLKILENQTTVPVLLAIDPIDAVLKNSLYHDATSKPLVLASSFTFFREVLDFVRDRRRLKRGAVLIARGNLPVRRGRNATRTNIKLSKVGRVEPQMASDKKWFTEHGIAHEKTAVLIVPNFEPYETEAVCEVIRRKGQNEGDFPYTAEGMGPMLHAISQGNPRKMVKHLSYM